MYDPWQVLATVDRSPWLFLALCGSAMIANYVWFINAYRVSMRYRIINIPVFCTLFWFAHDTSVLYRFDLWFNYYDHWFTKFWWFALVFTVAFETAFMIRVVRLGPSELLPGGSRKAFAAILLAGVISSAIIWENVKAALGDPLYLFIFAVTIVAFPPLVVAHLMKRQSSAGYNTLQMGAYTVMSICYFIALVTLLPGVFLTPLFVGLALVSVIGGLILTYVIHQMNHNGRTFGLVADRSGTGGLAVSELARQ